MSQLKSPNDWFAAGRIMATQKMPYFTAAVMGLVPYQVPGFGTLAVSDRGVLLWDPELSKKWTVENLAWVILHEAGHYLRDHAGRRKQCAAEHSMWNLAGDAEINDDLVAAGAVFPKITQDETNDPTRIGQPSGVLPKDIDCEDGRLAEEYYAHLRKNAKVIEQGTVSMEGSGNGKGKKGTGSSKTLSVLAGKGKNCGSGAGQEPSPEEAQVPNSLGKSPAEQKRVQREVAEAIRNAASKGRGNIPLGLQRWAEEVLGPPRVAWQSKLARSCRAAVAFRPGAGDYRYDRPSRRQGAFGYGTGSPVFPALRMPVPRCAIIVDTSGSMGEAELKVGLEETKGILTAIGAEVDFLACDTEVHSARPIRTVQEATKLLKGGGGTNMQPAFAAVQRRPKRPEVVVCVTDGQIGDPGPPPRGMKVIWLVCGQFRDTRSLAWGEVIELDSLPE